MQQLKIVIAGGSGFIGQGLTRLWHQTNNITILSRGIRGAKNNAFSHYQFPDNVQFVNWDGKNVGQWAQCLEGCDILVNLAGESVNCIYNEANKAAMLNSRVDSVKALGEAIKTLKRPPLLFVQTASATIYRHAEDSSQDEYNGEIEDDFSVQVCKSWEAAFNNLQLPNTRKVISRTAITLERGGVLVPFQRLVAAGLGGRQGSGRQMFSWLHLADFAGIVAWLHENPLAVGTYNAVAPNPVNNDTFMATVRNTLATPVGLPLPEWFIKIAVPLFCTEPELLLKSRWVLPTRLLNEGYVFQYPQLDVALEAIYQPAFPRGTKLAHALKIVDLVLQPLAVAIPLLACKFTFSWLTLPYVELGAVQVLSAVLNGLFFPAALKAGSRSYYNYHLLVIAGIALVLWCLTESAIIFLAFVLMYFSVFSAIWYYLITVKEYTNLRNWKGE